MTEINFDQLTGVKARCNRQMKYSMTDSAERMVPEAAAFVWEVATASVDECR